MKYLIFVETSLTATIIVIETTLAAVSLQSLTVNNELTLKDLISKDMLQEGKNTNQTVYCTRCHCLNHLYQIQKKSWIQKV
jgi:hypothetical protein